MITASSSGFDIERPSLALHDDDLVRLLAEVSYGSREAQRQLYEYFHRRVYRLLIRMVGRDDAEDLLQQVRQEQQKAQRAPRVHAVRRAPKPEGEDPRFRDVESEGEAGADAPAKKRRRRRRKPTGESGSAPAAE